jgi:hypothetical protein
MPPSVIPSALLACLALLLGAACARHRPDAGAASDRSGRSAVLLSSWQPAAGQKCAIAKLPRDLPAAHQLVDTADLSVFLGQGGVLRYRGYALLSLKFDSAGAPTRVMAIETDLPDGAARAAELAVHTALRPQSGVAAEPRAEWGVRLRIDVDSVANYRVGRSERCEPYRARGTAGRQGGGPPPGLNDGQTVAKGRQSVSLRLVIGADGRVLDGVLLSQPGASLPGTWANVESLSHQRDFTEHLLRSLRSEKWQPGLDDRVPVAMPVVVTEQLTTVVKVGR